MERYIEKANIPFDGERSLFRGLIAGMRLRPSGGLSYTRVRELVLEMLSGVGLEKSKYGLHSLRAGGARAAANAGVADRWFKGHGHWNSENAKDGYVKRHCKRQTQSYSESRLVNWA